MHSTSAVKTSTPPLHGGIWLLYVAFVIYGSLVPLNYHPYPLDEAVELFLHSPMFNLGIESRADWIANGVLYVPVGFLTAHLLIQKYSEIPRFPLHILAALFSVALAFGVEFTQIFFPPRTVSLNDLLAESIGGLIGLTLAAYYSDWFKNLLCAVFSNPRGLVLRLAEAYLVGYVAFSLFPYDILLSGAELEQKLHGNSRGWLLADDPHGTVLTALKTLSEIVLTFPFGLFLGYRSARRPATYKQASLWGGLLGCFIEVAQFFTATGVSQGLSVLTRIAGVCGGLALWNRRSYWSPEKLDALAQRYALPLGVIYLLVLLQVNGWFNHQWNSIDVAVSRLGELHFLPFYYHYYTSEAKALVSLSFVCLTYFPIGLLAWSNRRSPSQAFALALFTVFLIETGKLFLTGMHADPTNILLGAFTSWSVVHLTQALFRETTQLSVQENPAHPPPLRQNLNVAPQAPNSARQMGSRSAYITFLAALSFAAYYATTFPTQPLLLCVFLTTCAATIWYRPAILVAIIPAALPILDLAPWSGRFYLDEFDLLVLVSLAVGYNRIPHVQTEKKHIDPIFSVICGLVAISFSISAVRGLLPWQPLDANAFTNYYSPLNAFRILKGTLWSFLCYRLLRRMTAADIKIKRPLAVGIVTGLALTVAVILWERLTFSGLFNFSSDYRVTGPFSSMHTGGAYIECFLAIATPFLVLLILQIRNLVCKLLGVALLLATTYALMVTFSRNGYSAFGIALGIMLFFATFNSGRWQQRSLTAIALSGAILAVATPVFTGKFAQDRMSTIRNDLAVRQAHWNDALDIRSPDLLTTLFGMGLGRYPEAHYLLSRENNRSGTYQLMTEGQNTFVRLVSGNSIYLDQLVSVNPGQKYLLKLDAKINKPGSTLTIPICEKWLLASYNCMWSTFNIGKEIGVWRHFESQLSSEHLDVSHWYSQRPIKLALFNGNANSIVDVDNVRLETIQGENLVHNGDFSSGLDHWFFSADSHLQWHIKSFPVAVLFDQGWFGLMALCAFSILAIKRAAASAWRGDLNAAAVLAAFSGFLVVGLFDTLIDAPRFLFLLLLLGWFCGFRNLSKSSTTGKAGDIIC